VTPVPPPSAGLRVAGTLAGFVALGLAVGATTLFVQRVVAGWVLVNDASGIEILVGALVLASAFTIALWLRGGSR
jgi:hypothetical protein